MTFAEFEQLPDTPGKRELIDGEVVSMPPPDWKHSQLTTNLVLLFATGVNKRLVFGDHTGYRIGSAWIEPDASVSWPEQRRDEKYRIGSPMIAVEILHRPKRLNASSPSISTMALSKSGCSTRDGRP